MVNKKLNIGYVTTEYNYSDKIFGGLASYLNKSTKILTSSGHCCVVFVLTESNFLKVEKNVKIVGIKEKAHWLFLVLDVLTCFIFHKGLLWLGKSFQMKLAIQKFLKNNDLDVLQYCSAYGLGYFRLKQIPNCVRINSLKYVQNLALNKNKFQDKVKAWIELKAISKFTYIFAPSQGTINQLYRLTRLQGKVINTPYLPPIIDKNNNFPTIKHPYMLYVGTINKLKGFLQLVAVIPEFLRLNTTFSFVFIGPEQSVNNKLPSEYLDDFPELKERCIFLGKQEKPILIEFLKNAEAIVIPSLSENLPNTGIEAICNSIPVIASLESNMGEIIENGVHGYTYPAANSDRLLSLLLEFTKKSRSEINKMKESQKMNSKQFSKEVYSNAIIKYYESVILNSNTYLA